MAIKKINKQRDELQGALLDDEDFLKVMVEKVCQRIMEAEMTEFIGADPHERTDNRKGYRNGFKPRILRTRIGELNLLVPKDREGRFSSSLFNRYQRNEKALILALQEMYLQGVSTRKVKEITEALCGLEISKSLVSDLARDLDLEILAWRNRKLTQDYSYLIIDARYEKIRTNNTISSQGVLITLGIGADGKREILSVDVADSESETSWSEAFRNLKERGLSGVRLITSDDHGGLVNAAHRHFQGISWQRCQFHFTKNILDITPKKERRLIYSELKSIFDSPDQNRAKQRLSEVIETYQSRYPKIAEKLSNDAEDVLTCFNFPSSHRRRIRTTNTLERFNQEIKRRTNVVRIFPNADSAIRLISALAIEQSEEWMTGRMYLDMDELKSEEYSIDEKEESSKITRLVR
jgi:transposase-like protein